MPLISSGVEDRVLSLLFPSNAVCIAGTQVGRGWDNRFDDESRVGMERGISYQMKEKDLIKGKMYQVRSGQFVIVVRDDDEPWPCGRSQKSPHHSFLTYYSPHTVHLIPRCDHLCSLRTDSLCPDRVTRSLRSSPPQSPRTPISLGFGGRDLRPL